MGRGDGVTVVSPTSSQASRAHSLQTCGACGQKLPRVGSARPAVTMLRSTEDVGGLCSVTRIGRTGSSEIDTEVAALCRALGRLSAKSPWVGSSSERPSLSPSLGGQFTSAAESVSRGLLTLAPGDLRARIESTRPRSAGVLRPAPAEDGEVAEHARADAMVAMKALDRLISFVSLELAGSRANQRRLAVLEARAERSEAEVKELEERLEASQIELAAARDPENMKSRLTQLLSKEQQEYQERLARQEEAALEQAEMDDALSARAEKLVAAGEALLPPDQRFEAAFVIKRSPLRTRLETRQQELAAGRISTSGPHLPANSALWPIEDGAISCVHTPDDWLSSAEMEKQREFMPSFYAMPASSPFLSPTSWDTFGEGTREGVGRSRAPSEAPGAGFHAPAAGGRRQTTHGRSDSVAVSSLLAHRRGVIARRRSDAQQARKAAFSGDASLETFLSSSKHFAECQAEMPRRPTLALGASGSFRSLGGSMPPSRAGSAVSLRAASADQDSETDEDVSDDEKVATVAVDPDGNRRVLRLDEQRTFWGKIAFLFQHSPSSFFELRVDTATVFSFGGNLAEQSARYGLEAQHERLLGIPDACVVISELTHDIERERADEAEYLEALASVDGEAPDSDSAPTSLAAYKVCEPGAVVRATNRLRAAHRRLKPQIWRRLRQPGILNALATQHGKLQWQNPHTTRVVCVTASSEAPLPSTLAAVTDRPRTEADALVPFFSTLDAPSQWVTVDLGPVAVIPHRYSLVSARPIGAGCFPRSWRLEGSLDNEVWELLRRHEGDTTLTKDRPCATWSLDALGRSKVREIGSYYRYFRLTQEGPNSVGTHALQLSCFEVYGRLLCVRPWMSWPCRSESVCLPRPLRCPELPPMPEEPRWRARRRKVPRRGKGRK
eukprot:TRINITY_DN18130_c0_g1_i1.p1 TRINITY_DN18130_c0_g1~~TRINITY_DN18130_c0_g1_i1.p1  ORF type:complete len:898 (+),score=308.39 TRINITY_DN18130_c0_g1_i1:45-2738(+)